MERPLNIHPDVWKNQYNNGQIKKEVKVKKTQLDDYTKLNNSIDMMCQALQIFKTTYDNLIVQQFTKEQQEKLEHINDVVQQALIPYTIEIIEDFKFINKGEQTKNEQ